MFFSLKRVRVSPVNGDISDAPFKSVPSKSKNIRFIKTSMVLAYRPNFRPISHLTSKPLRFVLKEGYQFIDCLLIRRLDLPIAYIDMLRQQINVPYHKINGTIIYCICKVLTYFRLFYWQHRQCFQSCLLQKTESWQEMYMPTSEVLQ